MEIVKRHIKLTRLVACLAFLMFFATPSSAQESVDAEVTEDLSQYQTESYKKGRSIFKSKCASCHKLDKKFIGPGLSNIGDKREVEWLQEWIKDNGAFRASGDADAIAVFNEYGGVVMSAFPELSNEDIDAILEYTKVGEKKKVGAVAEASEEEQEGSDAWMVYLVTLIIVLGILWVFFKSDNGFLKIVSVIILILLLVYYGFSALMNLDVNEGYQPIQPIAFSHKIHAGDNKIECQYCHSSAKHSKTSGIPSVNVCMNCHLLIQEYDGDVTAEHNKEFYDGEIAKLLDAAGYDEEGQYDGKLEPIKWVRVHNLPDFVYYNHSQHVNVAGLDCAKCHGPVEEMEEVYQYSPLTMGWCIDCHKETQVDLKGNE